MQLFIQSGDLGPKWFLVAIRSMVVMAESDSLLKSNHIANLLGEDATTIRKILTKLVQAELVLPHGGRYGGYKLAKNPDDITLNSIYSTFSVPAVPYWSVPSTGSELYISLIISKAEEQFQLSLQKYTIRDILSFKVSK